MGDFEAVIGCNYALPFGMHDDDSVATIGVIEVNRVIRHRADSSLLFGYDIGISRVIGDVYLLGRPIIRNVRETVIEQRFCNRVSESRVHSVINSRYGWMEFRFNNDVTQNLTSHDLPLFFKNIEMIPELTIDGDVAVKLHWLQRLHTLHNLGYSDKKILNTMMSEGFSLYDRN